MVTDDTFSFFFVEVRIFLYICVKNDFYDRCVFIKHVLGCVLAIMECFYFKYLSKTAEFIGNDRKTGRQKKLVLKIKQMGLVGVL